LPSIECCSSDPSVCQSPENSISRVASTCHSHTDDRPCNEIRTICRTWLPPQNLSSPPNHSIYGYGNGDDAEEGAPERRRDGREHGEHKRDKARRCSRPARPLGDRSRDMLQLHPAAAFRSPRAPGPRPACPGRSPRAGALTVNADMVFATSALSTLL
jgi:hypothetical protein